MTVQRSAATAGARTERVLGPTSIAEPKAASHESTILSCSSVAIELQRTTGTQLN